jgi:hypothetical protein
MVECSAQRDLGCPEKVKKIANEVELGFRPMLKREYSELLLSQTAWREEGDAMSK